MIVQCADCNTRYQLDPSRVPARQIRVRCPSCRAIFAINGAQSQEAPAAPAPEPTPVAQPTPAPASMRADVDFEPSPGMQSAQPAAPAAATPDVDFEIERSAEPARKPQPAAAQVDASPATAVADAPAASPKPAADPAADKAKRLARALVSDILVYHRDARDQALADGTLVQVLGQEIKKSWELYKERVTPEVANGTNHFRDALNEILADGQQIF